jgi:hypothetical protein
MLERLDQIDWRSLNDAYGPATAVPGRIRRLASPSRHKREKALDDLSYTIYHQGSIYSSSVAAVPFLLEIVGSSDVADRSAALQLLQALSTGTSYHEVHAPMFLNREKSKTPEWQEKVREEKSWMAAIHEKLTAAIPGIIGVLRSGQPAERLAAVSLLATLQDDPDAAAALIVAAVDPNPALSAAAISAAGACDNARVEVFENCFERASNELVRTVAALQILYHRERNSAPVVVEYLLHHLTTPQAEIRKSYEALPDVGAFLGDLGKALACAPKAVTEKAFPLLYEEVKRSPYPLNHSETFGLLMLATVLNPPPDYDWRRIVLSQEQRLAIRLVADRAWRLERGTRTLNLNIVELLQSFGLPGERDGVFALLTGTPEAQTEREKEEWSSKRRRPPWRKFF